jgi:3-methyladenine DNA glycosylase AlkD
MELRAIGLEFKKLANPKKAKILARFFKTGKGEYGEGDVFLGITVPQTREVVKKYAEKISFPETKKLLRSKFHEERLAALLILVEKFRRSSDEKTKEKIFRFYLKNTRYINNWDLVDLSSRDIVGAFLVQKTYGNAESPLFQLITILSKKNAKKRLKFQRYY